MRKKIVAGNWKMNNSSYETIKLLNELIEFNFSKGTRVIVCPAHTQLGIAYEKLKNSNIEVASQNMHFELNGAFTGEISAKMIKSVGVLTSIIGHSERRVFFNETDQILTKKVETAIKENIEVIFCVGEELSIRKSKKHFRFVQSQLENSVFLQPKKSWNKIIVAYEPVWAIGTGETASPEEAQEMHFFIRSLISKKYGSDLANSVSIIYGGSVKPNNAKEIFAKPDVDGGLVGGASLNSEDFAKIVNAF
jgi:triosephosphate isomerase|tara:strand:+ start:7769 stop:8518 length:750 start_codon:yes stop_codon:yes gene_type:complete